VLELLAVDSNVWSLDRLDGCSRLSDDHRGSEEAVDAIDGELELFDGGWIRKGSSCYSKATSMSVGYL
jgi:hypothetical protein